VFAGHSDGNEDRVVFGMAYVLINRTRALVIVHQPPAYAPSRVSEAAVYLMHSPESTEYEQRLTPKPWSGWGRAGCFAGSWAKIRTAGKPETRSGQAEPEGVS
jgi:hypothetical protein